MRVCANSEVEEGGGKREISCLTTSYTPRDLLKTTYLRWNSVCTLGVDGTNKYGCGNVLVGAKECRRASTSPSSRLCPLWLMVALLFLSHHLVLLYRPRKTSRGISTHAQFVAVLMCHDATTFPSFDKCTNAGFSVTE